MGTAHIQYIFLTITHSEYNIHLSSGRPQKGKKILPWHTGKYLRSWVSGVGGAYMPGPDLSS